MTYTLENIFVRYFTGVFSIQSAVELFSLSKERNKVNSLSSLNEQTTIKVNVKAIPEHFFQGPFYVSRFRLHVFPGFLFPVQALRERNMCAVTATRASAPSCVKSI